MNKPNSSLVVQPTPSPHFEHRGHGAEEMRFAAAAEYGDTVPNDRMYIHNRARPPRIDLAAWRLEITGSAVARPLSLRHADLLALPQVTLRRTLDCGANGRAFFPKLSPYESTKWLPIGWTQWRFGAVGTADWTGARVKDVLDAAGLGLAANAEFTGLDAIAMSGGTLRYSQVIPIEKVLADDTILAYRMNGEELPADHGHPVRALFSGWGGHTSVKWLGSIEVSADPLPLSHFQKHQTLVGPDHPAPALLTVGPVRSALELAEDATILPGDHTLHGRAWSGAGAIDRVDVCLERLVAPGTWAPVWDPPWRDAKLLDHAQPMIWVRFEVSWEGAEPGRYRLMTRATDEAGRTSLGPRTWCGTSTALDITDMLPSSCPCCPRGRCFSLRSARRSVYEILPTEEAHPCPRPTLLRCSLRSPMLACRRSPATAGGAPRWTGERASMRWWSSG
jgi:DMSO/TMAO reductase YedYZ molybdopterin-dependent catalytic subunit